MQSYKGVVMYKLNPLYTVGCYCLLLLFLAGCAPQVPPKPNPMGLSGTVDPEAETAFSQARVLWRSSQEFQTRTPEVCSDPGAAIALLDKAITIEPGYSAAYIRRGLAKSDLGQHEPAFDDATIGIRLAATPENYAYRGLISMRSKNFIAAHKDLDYSLHQNASQHLAWTFSGVLALLEEDTATACANFGKACSNGDCSRLEAAKQEGICR